MAYGKQSKLRLATADKRLQELMTAVMADVDAGLVPGVTDLTVLCAYRGQAEQQTAFDRGTSKVTWPNSKHNKVPAQAVDVCPYPIDWKDVNAFAVLRGYIACKAHQLGIPVRFISWDWPHTELR